MLYVILDCSLGNARNPFRSSTSKKTQQSALAKVLIECGANVNSQDTDNWTPLHFASKFGYLDAARLLLDHGADANALNNNHLTPMNLASSEHGHPEIVQLLLRCGANHDAVDTKSLIGCITNVNSQDTHNQRLLHLAPKFRDREFW
jgi:ankyrin repeat protein